MDNSNNKDYTALMYKKILNKNKATDYIAINIINELLNEYNINLNDQVMDNLDWIIFNHKNFLTNSKINPATLHKVLNRLEENSLINREKYAAISINKQSHKIIKVKLLPKSLKIFLEN